MTDLRVTGWESSLLYKMRGGSPTSVLRSSAGAGSANAATVLRNDPRWAGVLAYDEFAETIVTQRVPPWRPSDAPAGLTHGDWTDVDTTRTQHWLADAYALDLGAESTLSAVMVAARARPFHPLRSWLDGLRWDGHKRVPTWLVDVMGCDDTAYVRAVGQAWAISAIARAYNPGCKVDTVLVLEGPPGTFKSSVLRAIVGDAWFLEMSITDVANKDAMQLLKRKWIGEFPEIDGLSRNEQSHVKAYFSRQVDTYRPSYGKGTRDFPRQTVFAATTNKSDWVTDETGGTGRRMWPVRCRRGDVGGARLMRDQFWAEARVRYEGGELWHITDPELRDAERAEQDTRFSVDPWEGTVAEWLAKPADVGDRTRFGVTTGDVLGTALKLEVGKWGRTESMRVGAVLRRLGWTAGNPEMRNGARVRLYRPTSETATLPVQADVTPLVWPEESDSSEDLFPPVERDGE